MYACIIIIKLYINSYIHFISFLSFAIYSSPYYNLGFRNLNKNKKTLPHFNYCIITRL